MKIKLTKPMPARQIHLAILAAGSVIDIDDRAAMRLVGLYGDLMDAPKEKKEAPAPLPPFDETVVQKPTATGKAAAMIEQDNEAVFRNLKEDAAAEDEPKAKKAKK
jgi:hypothetical protein